MLNWDMLPPPTQLNLSVAGSAEESVLVERLFRFGLDKLFTRTN
jgi:hypothetical protein